MENSDKSEREKEYEASRDAFLSGVNNNLPIKKNLYEIFKEKSDRFYEDEPKGCLESYASEHLTDYPILIIDDDESLPKVISQILQNEGYKTIIAKDGKQGLEALSQKPIMALVDNLMPKMNGTEVIKNIRENSKYDLFSEMYLISIGQGFPKEISEMCNDSLQKPFENSELVSAVKKGIEYKKRNLSLVR